MEGSKVTLFVILQAESVKIAYLLGGARLWSAGLIGGGGGSDPPLPYPPATLALYVAWIN